MKIMIVTDAWEPQVNGVVRTLKMTTRHLQEMGHSTHILSPLDFKSMPCPTYPEISLALASSGAVMPPISPRMSKSRNAGLSHTSFHCQKATFTSSW